MPAGAAEEDAGRAAGSTRPRPAGEPGAEQLGDALDQLDAVAELLDALAFDREPAPPRPWRNKPRCRACGAPVGRSYEHPMTGQDGDDGIPWHDEAAVLCGPCADATADMRNAWEFNLYRETGRY
jgi:hypothetical protein